VHPFMFALASLLGVCQRRQHALLKLRHLRPAMQSCLRPSGHNWLPASVRVINKHNGNLPMTCVLVLDHAGVCHGKALVLAPEFTRNSIIGGDESGVVTTILEAAGYEVTFKCDDALLCPDGGVTVEDFKHWEGYSAVSIATHGDSANNGSNPYLFTKQQYDNATYGADRLAGRIYRMSDGTMALTPRFFSTYTNQIKGLIIYTTACR
jgi:hypothetical protein